MQRGSKRQLEPYLEPEAEPASGASSSHMPVDAEPPAEWVVVTEMEATSDLDELEKLKPESTTRCACKSRLWWDKENMMFCASYQNKISGDWVTVGKGYDANDDDSSKFEALWNCVRYLWSMHGLAGCKGKITKNACRMFFRRTATRAACHI